MLEDISKSQSHDPEKIPEVKMGSDTYYRHQAIDRNVYTWESSRILRADQAFS